MSALPLRVDVDLDLDQIQQALCPSNQPSIDQPITGVCLDTRVLQKGDLFFAIQSARDGHDFLADAMAKGASTAVVSQPTSYQNTFLVNNTLAGLSSLANHFRMAWGNTVIGISGSNGKTTTKEFLHTLLGENAFKSPGTWNNHLGIPLSLFMLKDFHQYAVLEMGISDFGELRDYCEVAKPDIGVLTTIGYSHLMNLKNLEGVAKAKAELFHALSPHHTAVIMKDDPYIKAESEKLTCQKIQVSIKDPADIRITKNPKTSMVRIDYGPETFQSDIALHADHNLSNLACALGVAYVCGIQAADIQKRLPLVKLFGMRMQERKTPQGVYVVLDCYNANPTSMIAGLKAISDRKGRKIAFLGDMLELGEDSSELHFKIGKQLNQFGITHLFAIGQFAKDYIQGALSAGMAEQNLIYIQNRQEAYEKIRAELQNQDILYVKGSRGMKLEEIVFPLFEGE